MLQQSVIEWAETRVGSKLYKELRYEGTLYESRWNRLGRARRAALGKAARRDARKSTENFDKKTKAQVETKADIVIRK